MNLGTQLLELQATEDRIASLESEIAALEAWLRSDPELERARAEAEATSQRRHMAEAAVAEADRQVTALRERARLLDRQLYGGRVRNPQDLLALQHELEEVRSRLSAAEEVELARMEEAEEMARVEAEAVAALRAAEERRSRLLESERARLSACGTELLEARRRREELVAALPASVVRVYERLTGRRRPAVVRLLGEACGGCRVGLGGHEVHAVRAGLELVQCPNCDRILVR